MMVLAWNSRPSRLDLTVSLKTNVQYDMFPKGAGSEAFRVRVVLVSHHLV